ncbi:NAD(P)-binding protein [Thozetella sp. PMI_491]|nr:NAD(P)-binding protein [Thozetella sp. PMI_491]
MAGDLVLLTAGSGFLGHLVFLELLKSGYNIRAAVRSASKADAISAIPAVAKLAPSKAQLSFVVVPDMSLPGAYDDAAKGVKYIVHVANPMPSSAESMSSEELEKAFVEDTKAGVLGMLDSASKGGSVRRIVFTSSIAANVPVERYFAPPPDGGKRVFTPDDRVPVYPPPYTMPALAYAASKAAALLTTDDYIKNSKADFDIVTIIPSMILGRDERATTVDELLGGSSNAVLLNVLLGVETEFPYANGAAYTQDTARAHVLALNPEVPGNQTFVVNVMMEYADAIPIAKSHFPEAFASGIFKETGKQPTTPILWDTSKTEKVLGLKLTPVEAIVKEVASQYLELSAKK